MTAYPGVVLLASDTEYKTPWTFRRADPGTVVVVIEVIGSNTTLDIDVMTKNQGDADPTTALGSFTQITSSGTHTLRVTSVKELWRLEITVGGTGSFRFVGIEGPTVAWE